jgi:glycosyltransferase involved in cell wall biosynthesis
MEPTRGVAICHYNRLDKLEEIIKAVKATVPVNTTVVVCDDGSNSRIEYESEGQIEEVTVSDICLGYGVPLLQGPNAGVAANKNRALWALQDKHFICILEDDLKPIGSGWFEDYEKAASLSGIHHFCRVQNKEVPETVSSFTGFLSQYDLTPIYGPSPRGDLTFLTNVVVRQVGAFNPQFRGAGFAHGEWSHRVEKAGLVGHPLKWVDIMQCRDRFVQVGDTEGGRWLDPTATEQQIQRNRQVYKELQRKDYIYHELVLE